MARENQGIQVALIIFVMLAIVLGVTTYIFYGRYEEALEKVKVETAKATKSGNEVTELTADCAQLKEMIGVENTKAVAEVRKLFEEDMQKYVGKPDDGGTVPDTQKFYRPLVEQLFVTINARDKQLVAKEEQIRKCEQERADLDAKLQSQVDKYKKSAQAARADLVSVEDTSKSTNDRVVGEQKKTFTEADKTRKELQDSIAKIKTEKEAVIKERDSLVVQVRGLAEKLKSLSTETADSPLGEIRVVNQAAGTVYINLGRADALPRQISFSVYSPNATDLTKAGRKASIEVTQVTGEKEAVARIVEDRITDPIMPGDKIFTPVWRPGDKRHFALAGVLDLNGDGRSDLQAVKNLITMNGGIIDCEPTDKGDERVGEMTVNTRYLVLGNEPRGEAAITVWSRMNGDAKRLGVTTISLDRLLELMGNKPLAASGRIGASSDPKDKKSTTTFAPRTPPGTGDRH